MEYWDVYDFHRYKIGQVKRRGQAVLPDEYRLAVSICLFNRDGQMLIQKRQHTKQIYPGLWDITVTGGALAGETSQTAAKRELQEELGLILDFQHVRPHLTVNFDGGFNDYFLLEKDVYLENLILQKEEVEKVKWASRDEICSMIENNVFVPHYQSIIHLFFDMRKRYGSHSI